MEDPYIDPLEIYFSRISDVSSVKPVVRKKF